MPDWPFNLPAGQPVQQNAGGFPVVQGGQPEAPVGPAPASPVMQQIAQQIAQRKMGRQGRSLRNYIEGAPRNTEALDLQTDLQPYNIQELGRAIDAQKDPRLKAELLAEMQRLREIAGGLAGPLNPQGGPPEPEVARGNLVIPPLPANYAPPEPSPRGGVWDFGGFRGDRRM